MLQMCSRAAAHSKFPGCWHERSQMKAHTCSHSPTPLRVPLRSHRHSGNEKEKWVRLWKCKGGALQWIGTDYRILSNSWALRIKRSETSFPDHSFRSDKLGKKKERKRKLSPECPATVDRRHSWDIKNTPTPSQAITVQRESRAVTTDISGQNRELFFYWLHWKLPSFSPY